MDMRTALLLLYQVTICMTLMKSPPYRLVDKVFNVVVDGEKALTGLDLKYVDPDLDSTPREIKYSRRKIPNGALFYAEEPTSEVFQFTQEDLDTGKILFKHFGAPLGRAVLWVTDGQFYATGILEIKASKPYLRLSLNTGLVVKSGERGIISHHNLSIDTNMNVKDKDEVKFRVTSAPKLGTLLDQGQDGTFFTLSDLEQENLEYEATLSGDKKGHESKDAFEFEVLFHEMTYEGRFEVTIFPETFWDPLTVDRNRSLTLDEGKLVTITSELLKVSHSTIEPQNITYLITLLPKFGILILSLSGSEGRVRGLEGPEDANETDIRDHIINDSVLLFTQQDIDESKIHYLQTIQQKDVSEDCFRFDVTNGITTIRDLTFRLNIISRIITLTTGNISVMEGHAVTLLPTDLTVSNAFYETWIDQYLIIEDPKHGTIKVVSPFPAPPPVPGINPSTATEFSPNELRMGLVTYEHEGSETTRDWFTVVARANGLSKESAPATIHVLVDAVNDEAPHVINNTGLQLWEGQISTITNSHLASGDEDSPASEICYTISSPSNGYIALRNDTTAHVDRFSQDQIDSSSIVFVHIGDLSGGFRFQVNDGFNFDSPHVFTVTARPVAIQLLVNEVLHVFPRMQQSITRDHLVSATNDGNTSRAIVYQIVREPAFGRILVENSDGTTRQVTSFTQQQINDNLLLYEQNLPMNQLILRDSMSLDIESRLVQTIKGIDFGVEITVANFGKGIAREVEERVTLVPVLVREGKGTPINETHINVSGLTEYWKEKKLGAPSDLLYLRIVGFPEHGSLLYGNKNLSQVRSSLTNKEDQIHDNNDGGTSAGAKSTMARASLSLPLSVLKEKSLVYQHDDSNTFNDSIVFGVYIQLNSALLDIPTEALFYANITINVIPVNDENPILLTEHPLISVIQGSTSLINNSILCTLDADGLPEDIVYEIISGPDNGFLAKLEEEEGKAIRQFTQWDVDSNLVYFKHNGLNRNPAIFHFMVSDGNYKRIYAEATIEVIGWTLKLVNRSDIEIRQGASSVRVTNRHLGSWSNEGADASSLVVYEVTEAPRLGKLLLRDQPSDTFSQRDLDSSDLVYLQTNMSASGDHFVVSLFNSKNVHNLVPNITVRIIIVALIKEPKKPYLVAGIGQKVVLTLDHLDATLLAAKTRSNPVFRIMKRPRYGYLKKLQVNTRSTRSPKQREISQFTHEDIVKQKVVLVVAKEIKFKSLSESVSDVLELEVSANNVQPARTRITLLIMRLPTVTTTPFPFFKPSLAGNHSLLFPGTRRPDIPGIQLISPNISYFNVVITKDHLIITGIVLFIILVTVLLLLLIRVLHVVRLQSEYNRKQQLQQQIAAINGFNPSPSLLDRSPTFDLQSPVGSEFKESLVLSHLNRALGDEDPRLPAAPPTSPSLSTPTTCGSFREKLRSAPNKSPMVTPFMSRASGPPTPPGLRGGGGGRDDDPALDIRRDGRDIIFPLPPPSLYFGADAGLDPGNCSPSSSASFWYQMNPASSSSYLPTCKVSPVSSHYSPDHFMTHSTNRSTNSPLDTPTMEPPSSEGTPLPPLRRVPWGSDEPHFHVNLQSASSPLDHETSPPDNLCPHPSGHSPTACRACLPKTLRVTSPNTVSLSPTETPRPRRKFQYWV